METLIIKKLLLPDVEFFQSEVKERPPLIKFYNWVLRESDPMLGVLSSDDEVSEYLRYVDCTKIVIHENYDKKLRKITKKFLMKKYRMYAKSAERELTWHFLDVGPSTRELDNKNEKYVYLLKGYLRG